MNIIELNKTKKYIKQCNVLFLDLFDTLLKRKYSPLYSFYVYSNYLINNYHISETIHNLAYSLSYFFLTNESEVNSFSKIYYHYQINNYITFNYFCEKSKCILLNAELNNIEISKNVNLLINECKRCKIKIVILSDFYFGKDYLISLLGKVFNNNVFYDDIISSSEVGYTKLDNEMYQNINKKYNLHNSLFVDDNISISSLHKNHNYKYINVNSTKSYNRYNRYNLKYDKNSKKSCKELLIKKKNYYSCNYVFFIFHFLKKLYSELDSDREVLFVSREGHFLKECFDLFLEKNNLKNIKTKHLNVSRLSLALLSEERNINFAHYISNVIVDYYPKKNVTPTEVLKCLGFSSEDINIFLQTYSIPNIIIDKDNTTKLLAVLWEDMSFRRKCEDNRKNALDTLRRNLGIEKEIVVVDVGWKGTIQNCLAKLFNDKIIKGYYLGTMVPKYEERTSLIKGLIFDYNNHPFYYNNYDDIICLEALLRANHGQVAFSNSLTTYEIEDHSVEVYKEYSKNRQLIMMGLIKKIISLDEKQPINLKVLYDLEKEIITKKPLFARTMDYYYSIKHCYGQNVSFKKFFLKGFYLSFKSRIRFFIEKHPTINRFIRRTFFR